jgi:hypothetical protein
LGGFRELEPRLISVLPLGKALLAQVKVGDLAVDHLGVSD